MRSSKLNILKSYLRFAIIFCGLIHIVTASFNPTWWSSVAQLAAHRGIGLEPMAAFREPLRVTPKPPKPECAKLNGLSPGQARVCELFADHMTAVGLGAKNAIEECQFQFRGRRWNCSTVYGSGIWGPVHDAGTREAAFSYSLIAAGVMWEVSRGCRQGALSTCSCNQEPRPDDLSADFLWGGCGDNIQYGYQFAQNFVDVRERERPLATADAEYGRALMNRWNNEVGRKIMKRMSRVACKCHGVSGSCNVKSCWKQLPSLREVADILRQRYDEAVRVRTSRRGNLKLMKGGRKRRAAQVDLVYLDDSPDYCRPDSTRGVAGTESRQCNRSVQAGQPDSCEMLCCGRGYNTLEHVQLEKCHCRFVWCCKVHCRICQTKVELHRCK